MPDVAGRQLDKGVDDAPCRRLRQRRGGAHVYAADANGDNKRLITGTIARHAGLRDQPHTRRSRSTTRRKACPVTGSDGSPARTALTALGAVGAVGVGAAVWGIGIERYLFTVRRHELRILPPGTAPLRVLHLSDAHMAPWQHRKQQLDRGARGARARPDRQHRRQPRPRRRAARPARRVRPVPRHPGRLRARLERPRRTVAAQSAAVLHRPLANRRRRPSRSTPTRSTGT